MPQVRVGWRAGSSQVSAALATAGLILHLDSGNTSSYPGSGTIWTDLTGNGRNATLVNGAAYSSADGGKISFDGINDYAEIANPPEFGSSDFTIEVWFKRKTSSLAWDDTMLVTKWNNGSIGGSNEWGFSFGDSQDSSNGNNLNLGIEAQGGGLYGISSPEEILINTWYQAVAIREGGTLKIYINGSLRTSASPSVPVYGPLGSKSINNAGRKLRLAYHDSAYSAYYTNVEVPILRMYSRALSSTEVAQNYLNNKARFGMEDNPQILNNLIMDINPSLYVPGSPTLINPANVGNNIKVWGNETDPSSAPTWNRKWFTFDGINDYLEIRDAKPFMFGTQSFTISGWLKQKSANFGWNGAGFTKWNTGGSPGANNWSMGLAGDYNILRPSFTIDSSGTFYSVSSSENVSTNSWYHVVAVRDGGTLRIYVNGILKGTNSPAGLSARSITNYSQPLYIGKIGAGYNAFMDAGRSQIYNKALSGSEVLSLYNAQKTDFIVTNGLQYYIDAWIASSYSGTGTTVYDISGNGRSGSLTGGAYYNSGTSSAGGSFVFDGQNDYIQTNYTHNLAAGADFTANVWANGRSYSINDSSIIVSNYNGTPTVYNLYAHKNGKFACYSRDNNDVSTAVLMSTTTITDKWYYLTYKKQGATFSLYVNGVLEATATANLGAITPNNSIVIGQQNAYFSQPYLGKIGEVHLYSVALSDNDILHNFTSTRTRYGV